MPSLIWEGYKSVGSLRIYNSSVTVPPNTPVLEMNTNQFRDEWKTLEPGEVQNVIQFIKLSLFWLYEKEIFKKVYILPMHNS